MPYSREELKNELLRCYEEEGTVTASILNSSDNDYPTQVTYSNHFGSLTEAKEAVGIRGRHTADRVVSDVKKCYEKNGSVSIRLLKEDDEFINPSSLYRHYDSIWNAVNDAGLSKEDVMDNDLQKQYTRDELEEHLQRCYEEYGNTKTKTINNVDGPTTGCYGNRFETIDEARSELGVDEDTSWRGTKADELLDGTSFDDDADAHIYVLQISINGEEGYYVGESKNVRKRIMNHIQTKNIQSWANGPYGTVLIPREMANIRNDLSIDSIEYLIPLNRKDGESDIQFRRRRKMREHDEHATVIMEKETTHVYGGR